jgi:hypothetical protein
VSKYRVRFSCFPRTSPPPVFAAQVVAAFDAHYDAIATEKLPKGLTSDAVLAELHDDLKNLGFTLESGKAIANLIDRPVFFGENGEPELRYHIDGYHPTWRCGLEIEAGRGWMGNAVYRDLVQAMVMVDVDYLCLAVSNTYRYNSSGKQTVSKDYENTAAVAGALFGHSRVRMPFGLILIGY